MRVLLAILFLPLALARAESDPFSLTDISGKQHRPFLEKDVRAVVLVFITTDCPVANYFQPTLRRIESAYQKKGVRLFLVHSDPDTTRDAAKSHATEYGVTAPVVLDSDQRLARKFGARWTPEAVVFGKEEAVTYRGRIDDTYADYGKKRPKPTSEDLRDAIARFLAGDRPAKPVTTRPVGCPIYFPE